MRYATATLHHLTHRLQDFGLPIEAFWRLIQLGKKYIQIALWSGAACQPAKVPAESADGGRFT